MADKSGASPQARSVPASGGDVRGRQSAALLVVLGGLAVSLSADATLPSR